MSDNLGEIRIPSVIAPSSAQKIYDEPLLDLSRNVWLFI